jgi:predicted nucleic acid-binding protein
VNAFFDTNILVYAQETGAKADRARAVFAAGGKLSVQVLNEFAAVARRKLGHEWDQIAEAVDDALVLAGPALPLTLDLHITARMLAKMHRLSFYDALIVAAALEAGCDTLYSEDMQHGRTIGTLRIQNPFVESLS